MNKKFVCTLLSLLAVALVLGVGTAMAQEIPSADHVYALGYYANAKASGAPDAQLRLSNDGFTETNLWASIYVFNDDEQMEECCSCIVTPDGYLDLDVNRDLLGNLLTPENFTSRGIIKVISSGDFDPSPVIGIRGWLTHIQNGASAGAFSITQSDLKDSFLSEGELYNLEETCNFVVSLGSGAGVCSCKDAGH